VTIGDHIKKRRMDLRLLQKDIAKRWNVTEETITNWENGYSIPMISYYPLIIEFLGYSLWQFDTNTLSGKILEYRHRYGLSAKQLGRLLGVNLSTVRSWELNESTPSKQKIKKLELLLANKPLD